MNANGQVSMKDLHIANNVMFQQLNCLIMSRLSTGNTECSAEIDK